LKHEIISNTVQKSQNELLANLLQLKYEGESNEKLETLNIFYLVIY